MTPYYEADGIAIYHGDCAEIALFPPAPLVWQVIWVDAGGEGLGTCGHRHGSPDEATLCPFEPAALPDVCAGLVRQVRDPEYRTEGQRIAAAREARRPRQLELALEGRP